MSKPTEVMTGKVRLSYANLLKPKAQEEGKTPKYSVLLLIPKSDTKTVTAIKQAIEAAKEEGKASWGGKVPPGLKIPLRDGDTERDSPEYVGHWFINASSIRAPKIVDAKVDPIIDPNEIYSGMYAKVILNFYPYVQSGNRGVAAGLGNIQKVADGEPLGGSSARPENQFSAITEDFLS